MFRTLGTVRTIPTVSRRTFKNFGHKRQPIPFVTTLWHGFLTFTFIGLGLEWDWFKKLIFEDSKGQNAFSNIEDPSRPITSG